MKPSKIISAALYLLGLLTALGGVAVAAYLLWGTAAARSETKQAVSTIWIGVTLMAASFVIERLPPGKKRKR